MAKRVYDVAGVLGKGCKVGEGAGSGSMAQLFEAQQPQ